MSTGEIEQISAIPFYWELEDRYTLDNDIIDKKICKGFQRGLTNTIFEYYNSLFQRITNQNVNIKIGQKGYSMGKVDLRYPKYVGVFDNEQQPHYKTWIIDENVGGLDIELHGYETVENGKLKNRKDLNELIKTEDTSLGAKKFNKPRVSSKSLIALLIIGPKLIHDFVLETIGDMDDEKEKDISESDFAIALFLGDIQDKTESKNKFSIYANRIFVLASFFKSYSFDHNTTYATDGIMLKYLHLMPEAEQKVVEDEFLIKYWKNFLRSKNEKNYGYEFGAFYVSEFYKAAFKNSDNFLMVRSHQTLINKLDDLREELDRLKKRRSKEEMERFKKLSPTEQKNERAIREKRKFQLEEEISQLHVKLDMEIGYMNIISNNTENRVDNSEDETYFFAYPEIKTYQEIANTYPEIYSCNYYMDTLETRRNRRKTQQFNFITRALLSELAANHATAKQKFENIEKLEKENESKLNEAELKQLRAEKSKIYEEWTKLGREYGNLKDNFIETIDSNEFSEILEEITVEGIQTNLRQALTLFKRNVVASPIHPSYRKKEDKFLKLLIKSLSHILYTKDKVSDLAHFATQESKSFLNWNKRNFRIMVAHHPGQFQKIADSIYSGQTIFILCRKFSFELEDINFLKRFHSDYYNQQYEDGNYSDLSYFTPVFDLCSKSDVCMCVIGKRSNQIYVREMMCFNLQYKSKSIFNDKYTDSICYNFLMYHLKTSEKKFDYAGFTTNETGSKSEFTPIVNLNYPTIFSEATDTASEITFSFTPKKDESYLLPTLNYLIHQFLINFVLEINTFDKALLYWTLDDYTPEKPFITTEEILVEANTSYSQLYPFIKNVCPTDDGKEIIPYYSNSTTSFLGNFFIDTLCGIYEHKSEQVGGHKENKKFSRRVPYTAQKPDNITDFIKPPPKPGNKRNMTEGIVICLLSHKEPELVHSDSQNIAQESLYTEKYKDNQTLPAIKKTKSIPGSKTVIQD